MTQALANPRRKRLIEVKPHANGEVRCTLERHGHTCNNLVGVLATQSAQWHCRHCDAEIIVKVPDLALAVEISRVAQVMVANPSRQTKIALMVQAETIASMLRASLLES